MSRGRRWFHRTSADAGLRPAQPRPEPPSDDVTTCAPGQRPSVVLVELAAAVLDLAPLHDAGFSEGPIGQAGAAVLATLVCAGAGLDDPDNFDRVMRDAVAAGIFAGDLNHSWNEADPDGHYDNTWLGERYRTEGYVLEQLQRVRPHPDVPAAVTALRSAGVRLVAIPFLAAARTRPLLGLELAEAFEFPDVAPAASLTELIKSVAAGTGSDSAAIAVIATGHAITTAAMESGLGTVWLDRTKRVRGSVYTRGKSFTYRWSSTAPVPAIVDDFPDAARLLLTLPDRPSLSA